MTRASSTRTRPFSSFRGAPAARLARCVSPAIAALVVVVMSACSSSHQARARTGERSADCEANPNSRIRGSSADWTHRGAFDGYEVLEGCAQDPSITPMSEVFPEPVVVVEGKGTRWFGDIEPCPAALGACHYTSERISTTGHERQRAYAVSYPGVSVDVPSRGGQTASTACTGRGMYLTVTIADWHDMDAAVDQLGAALRAGDLRERIGIRMEPVACAIVLEGGER